MIRPYLSDKLNDHKTPKNLRVHSRNEVIDYEAQYGEWKIQLTMQINFFFFEVLEKLVLCIPRVVI